MERNSFVIEGIQCVSLWNGLPRFLLIQPVDDIDQEFLDRETEIIHSLAEDCFLLAAFQVNRWQDDLSPWDAPPVFGENRFGAGAAKTLGFIIDSLIPCVQKEYGMQKSIPTILGGYSLAALFSLWSIYQTNVFAAVAAASPSVWFPGWIEYAESQAPKAQCVYLSLGDREEKTRNSLMRTVGDHIRTQNQLLVKNGCMTVLEWNKGNHFADPEVRCAKGFAWSIHALSD